MVDINFLTSNPAIDEYNRAQKVAQDEITATLRNKGQDISNQKGQFDLDTAEEEGPTRLRQLNAQATGAEADASSKTAAAPFAGPQAAATVAVTEQNTRTSIANMTSGQAKLHMEAFTKSLELLDQGNIDGAKQMAASVGDTIPDAIINNTQARAAIKQITAAAQQYFPGRPKDQMAYITAHLTELGRNQQPQGVGGDMDAAAGNPVQPPPVNPQTAPFQPAPGAPTPPETGNVQTGEIERIAAQIRSQTPGMTYEQSIQSAHGRSNQEFERVAAANARADPNYVTDPQGTLQKYRQLYGLGGLPGAPAAAPAAQQAPPAPQRPASVPAGSAYSPSRKQWRDSQGNIFSEDGSRVQAPPQVPRSQ